MTDPVWSLDGEPDKVLRGGAWSSSALAPAYCNDRIGFRCARVQV